MFHQTKLHVQSNFIVCNVTIRNVHLITTFKIYSGILFFSVQKDIVLVDTRLTV